MSADFPSDFDTIAATQTVSIPVEVDEYLALVEDAAHAGTDAASVQGQGLSDMLAAARKAVGIVSVILCTDDERYADTRSLLKEDIAPVVDVIVEVIAILSIADDILRAIAVGALRVAYRTLEDGFCASTAGLRELV